MKIVTRKKATEQVATEMKETDFREVLKLSKSLGIEKFGELQDLYNAQKNDGEELLDFLRRKTRGAKEEIDVINEAFEDDGDFVPADEFADDEDSDSGYVNDDVGGGLSEEARAFLAQGGNHIYTELIRSFEADFDSPTSLVKDANFCSWLIENTYFTTSNPECEYDDGDGTFMGEVDLADLSKHVTSVHYEAPDEENPNSIVVVADVTLSGYVTVYGNEHNERVYPDDRPDLTIPSYDEKTLDAVGYATIRAYYDDASGETEFDDAEVEELEYN